MICLKYILAYYSVNFPFSLSNSRNYPPYRYSMMTTNFIFLRVQQLIILTIFGWLKDFMFSAYRKIMSIQLEELALFGLMTLIAAYYPVMLFLPKETAPKPPSPRGLIISYYPKFLFESKSSPLLTKTLSPFFKQSKSSSKSQTASTPQILIFRCLFCHQFFYTNSAISAFVIDLMKFIFIIQSGKPFCIRYMVLPLGLESVSVDKCWNIDLY